MVEVDLVVLDPADREAEVDLQRAEVRVDLVRGAGVDVAERAEDLVPLRDVALVELVVRLDRRARDPVELEQRRLERARRDLLVLEATSDISQEDIAGRKDERSKRMAFEVPPLPYDYAALEPTIDEQTMRLHHDKHHQAYVDNANAALAGTSGRTGRSSKCSSSST